MPPSATGIWVLNLWVRIPHQFLTLTRILLNQKTLPLCLLDIHSSLNTNSIYEPSNLVQYIYSQCATVRGVNLTIVAGLLAPKSWTCHLSIGTLPDRHTRPNKSDWYYSSLLLHWIPPPTPVVGLQAVTTWLASPDFSWVNTKQELELAVYVQRPVWGTDTNSF